MAHAAISRGSDSGRQVRLQVELQDEFGETVMLESRTTNKDWVVYEGEPVTVIYDPANPLGGWIEHDFKNRLRLVVILTPLFQAIGGVLMAIGFFSYAALPRGALGRGRRRESHAAASRKAWFKGR